MYRDGITPQNAVELVSSYDVVIDATDNAPSRYLISDACVVAGKPLVSGAAIGTDGQLTVYNSRARRSATIDEFVGTTTTAWPCIEALHPIRTEHSFLNVVFGNLCMNPLTGRCARCAGEQMLREHCHAGPCYRCLFPEAPEPQSCSRCSDAGVLGVVPGIMGSLQVLHTPLLFT